MICIFLIYQLLATTSTPIYNNLTHQLNSCFTRQERYNFEEIDFSKDLRFVLILNKYVDIVEFKVTQRDIVGYSVDISTFVDSCDSDFANFKKSENTIFLLPRDLIDHKNVDKIVEIYEPETICYIISEIYDILFDSKSKIAKIYHDFLKDVNKIKEMVTPYLYFLLESTHRRQIDGMVFKRCLKLLKSNYIEIFYDIFRVLCSYDTIYALHDGLESHIDAFEKNKEQFLGYITEYCTEEFCKTILTDDEMKSKGILSGSENQSIEENHFKNLETNKRIKISHKQYHTKEASDGRKLNGDFNDTKLGMKEKLKQVKDLMRNPLHHSSATYFFMVLRNKGKLLHDIISNFYDSCDEDHKKYLLNEIKRVLTIKSNGTFLNNESEAFDKQNTLNYVNELLSMLSLPENCYNFVGCDDLIAMVIISLVDSDYKEFFEGLSLFYSMLVCNCDEVFSICDDSLDEFIKNFKFSNNNYQTENVLLILD